MRLIFVYVSVAILTGCGTLYSLPPDNAWHSLAAIQAVDASGVERTQRLDLTSLRQSGNSECNETNEVGISVRVVEIEAFNDYSNLPDNTPPTSESPIRFIDSGPLDMSLVGAWRIVTIGTGYELLARANTACAVLRVKMLD